MPGCCVIRDRGCTSCADGGLAEPSVSVAGSVGDRAAALSIVCPVKPSAGPSMFRSLSAITIAGVVLPPATASTSNSSVATWPLPKR